MRVSKFIAFSFDLGTGSITERNNNVIAIVSLVAYS